MWRTNAEKSKAVASRATKAASGGFTPRPPNIAGYCDHPRRVQGLEVIKELWGEQFVVATPRNHFWGHPRSSASSWWPGRADGARNILLKYSIRWARTKSTARSLCCSWRDGLWFFGIFSSRGLLQQYCCLFWLKRVVKFELEMPKKRDSKESKIWFPTL